MSPIVIITVASLGISVTVTDTTKRYANMNECKTRLAELVQGAQMIQAQVPYQSKIVRSDCK